MYRIALCDDENRELEKTEQMLYSYGKTRTDAEFHTECFLDAGEFILRVREKNYEPDILFLDIYMPEKTGIEIARELREMGSKTRIVFLTMSNEHALEAYGVDAAQYLVKPVTEEKLFPLLDRFLGEMREEKSRFILLRTEGRICRVAVRDIVYFEAQGRKQFVHFADGSYCLLRITMAEIYGMLSGYREFVRVGAAYIVNLEHVESLSGKELFMDGGKTIYLPRGSYQPLRERYFKYFCGEEGGE